jgi:hypothetical protein
MGVERMVQGLNLYRWSPTGISDEAGIPACALQKRSKGIDVSLFIAVGVARGVRRACGQRPAIVIGNVSRETPKGCWLSGIVIHSREQLGRWAYIGRPA